MMSASATVASEESLQGVIEDHWQWVLQQYPERRLEYGDRSGNGQWTDNSLAAFQQRYEDEGAFVARLEQIEPATLGHDARINRNMLMRQLRETPDSRRIIISAWNVADIDKMALPPCHCLFQFWVADGKLSCQLYQRSCDIFLGVPFNIASYSLLTHMLAQQCDLNVGDFVWTGGDCHLYLNHLEQADEQLQREPLPLPRLAIKRRPPSIFDYEYEDFEILNYEAHPHIKAAVAV